MTAAAAVDDRLAFAPPKPPGLLRAFGLAVLAHVLLVLALMQGLHWKRDTQVAVEAELWSAVPQQAAPREVPVPVAPPPPPPPPQPVVRAPVQPEPPIQRDADIALEKAKQKRELEKEKQAQLEREREQRRKQLEAQKKHEEELARKKLEQQKLAEAKRKEEEKQQKLADAKRREEEKRKEDEKKRKQQEQDARLAKQREQIREENVKRSLAMAGTGAPDSTGTAARSAGPSASWAGRVQARVRPNIVFSDDISGNPKAEVEVRSAPDGTIVGKKLVRSSGVKAWDEAVLRALDKTEALPRDTDGRVPSPVVIEFKPKG
jgi:colicin import membrane protein